MSTTDGQLSVREPAPEYVIAGGPANTSGTLSIPSDLYARLQEYATATGKRLEQAATELLERDLRRIKPKSEKERFLAAMKKAGVTVRPLSDDLRKLILPGVKHEEVEAAFARAGGKPLSEIVIEQRGSLP